MSAVNKITLEPIFYCMDSTILPILDASLNLEITIKCTNVILKQLTIKQEIDH